MGCAGSKTQVKDEAAKPKPVKDEAAKPKPAEEAAAEELAAAEPVAGEPAVQQPADGPKCLGYTIETDPRIDPRVSAPYIAAGMGGAPPEVPGVTPEMSHEDILPATVAVEAGFAAVLEPMFGTYELCVALARCSLCFYPTPTGRLGN